jgi:hypothetical protein
MQWNAGAFRSRSCRTDRMRPIRMGVAMNEKQQLRQIAKLGIEDFETLEAVERMQRDMLRRLHKSSSDPDHYAGLPNCRLDYCGRVNCLEACPLGAFRRRLSDIPAALRLLENAREPFYEVRVSRALWSRPFGKLDEAGIKAAKQLNRRALDRLYDTDLIAVGTFKVAPSPSNEQKRWIGEIHQVVAGANKEDLERVLSTKQYRGEMRTHTLQLFVDYLRVSEVLRCDLSGWQHLWQQVVPVESPAKEQRAEFYQWLLGLEPRARLIYYGCDRHFKRLVKRLRPIPLARATKKRRYPHWLEPYFFGSAEREMRDRMTNNPITGQVDPKVEPRPRLDSRLEKYFGDPDDSYFDDTD